MSEITPLIAPRQNIRFKLDHHQVAGSHKARAARLVVQAALNDGVIQSGKKTRILEKSGGNFGIGLAYAASRLGIGVDLVIGLSFSNIKKRICQEYGAKLVGIELLEQGLQPRQVIEILLEEKGDEYFFVDQFKNPACLSAHSTETGPEILEQIHGDLGAFDGVTLVLAAGTGAHAAGLLHSFSASTKSVELAIVEPANCSFQEGVFPNHCQFGAAVGVFPSFLNDTMISRFIKVSDNKAREGQRSFARDMGYFVGPTSGANYFAALIESARTPNRLIVSMTYDSGESYIPASI